MKKKQPPSRPSPWMAVTIGLVGLAIGYVAVLGKTGELSASAAGQYLCPMKKEVCQGMDCNKAPACASGQCSSNCPGNCRHSV